MSDNIGAPEAPSVASQAEGADSRKRRTRRHGLVSASLTCRMCSRPVGDIVGYPGAPLVRPAISPYPQVRFRSWRKARCAALTVTVSFTWWMSSLWAGASPCGRSAAGRYARCCGINSRTICRPRREWYGHRMAGYSMACRYCLREIDVAVRLCLNLVPISQMDTLSDAESVSDETTLHFFLALPRDNELQHLTLSRTQRPRHLEPDEADLAGVPGRDRGVHARLGIEVGRGKRPPEAGHLYPIPFQAGIDLDVPPWRVCARGPSRAYDHQPTAGLASSGYCRLNRAGGRLIDGQPHVRPTTPDTQPWGRPSPGTEQHRADRWPGVTQLDVVTRVGRLQDVGHTHRDSPFVHFTPRECIGYEHVPGTQRII